MVSKFTIILKYFLEPSSMGCTPPTQKTENSTQNFASAENLPKMNIPEKQTDQNTKKIKRFVVKDPH